VFEVTDGMNSKKYFQDLAKSPQTVKRVIVSSSGPPKAEKRLKGLEHLPG